jgi:hypothetical protein
MPVHHYLVRPRHLAGGGDLTYVTAYLVGAGWKNRTPRAGSPICFEDPDSSVRITYTAQASTPSWIVSGAPADRPSWTASIGGTVPVEILGAFTDALAGPRPTHAPDVLGRATAHGWARGKGEHPSAGHPNGTALLQYRNDGDISLWWATAHTPGTAEPHAPLLPLWHAAFSEHTPLHAVEAFAAALADPRPVLRPPGHVPFGSAAHTTATDYPVLPSQLAAIRSARAAAGRAAAWARSASTLGYRRRHGAPLTRHPIRQAVPPQPPAPPLLAHPPRSQ